VTPREGGAAFAAPRIDGDLPQANAAPSPRAPAPAPQPVLIEAGGHTCLAWWHAPAVATAPALPLAVVLASSWGAEDLAAYDCLRDLAGALADAGLGTLRFEWPDTGDSSAATGSTTLADALTAFDRAAARALALSGHERLAFVGLRLGALLAAHAAAARLDVDALVALKPVTGGRSFVREQAVLRAARVAPRPGALFDPAALPVSLGGFALSIRQLEALAALRWPRAATTSVLEALLVQAPHPAGRTASDALARMGMRVCEQAHADPLGAPALAEVVRWLRERAADATVLRGVSFVEDFGSADPANTRTNSALAEARLDAATTAVLALAKADAPVWMRLREQGVAVRERVLRLEDAGEPALVGVLAERDRGQAEPAPRAAIVLLPSARERRVGPHRLWVPWARHRAALGDLVLRLDAAGAGDSATRVHGAGDEARGADDIARAVARLRREAGVSACTVVGIGEGATAAWRAALEGLGAQRVIAIDPTALRRPVPASARAARALLACADLLRPFETELAGELARAAERGVSLTLVLSQRGPAIGRRDLRLLRHGGVTICPLASVHPQFAGMADKAALYARLDALLASAHGELALPRVNETALALAGGRASCASEAVGVIARSSRRAA
jgi:alpha/beta superfamily hydrolase